MQAKISAALKRELGKQRVQVQLTRAQVAALKARSRDRGISVSALIREAVERDLSEPEVTRAELHRRAGRFIGSFGSGVGDLADKHDKHVFEDH